MRLLNTTTLLHEEFSGRDVPAYAILSHCWEEGEVLFTNRKNVSIQDSPTKTTRGVQKLLSTCMQAQEHGLDYVWIDSYCINRSSSAELFEAINSMFKWYEESDVCFVYLADIPTTASPDGGSRGDDRSLPMKHSRWFTRAWTLQELIAPKRVVFFDENWSSIGTKDGLAEELSAITGIDAKLLLGQRSISGYSVATRLSWAANRTANMVEDEAYCLLGLFDISMPLLYGEGDRAFSRLQDEIIRSASGRIIDPTVFTWGIEDYCQYQTEACSILAESPSQFRNYRDVEAGAFALRKSIDGGAHFRGPVDLWTFAGDEAGERTLRVLGVDGGLHTVYGLPIGSVNGLCQVILLIELNEHYFARVGSLLGQEYRHQTVTKDTFFLAPRVREGYAITWQNVELSREHLPQVAVSNSTAGIGDISNSILTFPSSNNDSLTLSSQSRLSSGSHEISTEMTSFPSEAVKHANNSSLLMNASDDIRQEDEATIYSDDSTSPAAQDTERYTASFGRDLFKYVSSECNDPNIISRVAEVMPLALEGFARNIGKEAAPQVYRDIMRFVYKHRREITNCFQHSVETQKEETTDARAESTIPLNEKIQHWLPEVEDSNEPISESEILYDGTWDEESDHDDDPPPVLETYHQIVTHSSAYLWLQSILQREILFHIPRIAYMGNISKAVFSHEIFRRISRRARPPSCDIKYLVDWNPFAFFHSQDYGTTPSEALESVLTHTGNGDEVEAVVCGDYIRRIWPQSGQAFLDLFRSILASNQGTWCNVTMTDGTRVAVSIQTSGVVLIASGQPDTVVEIGEQLAWISSALHPCERTGVTHSIPLIRNVTQTSQTESFVSIKIELSCVLEQNTQTRDEKGNCWQTLFDNPVIVQGYPIRRRRLQQTGLEMSIDVMATLVGTQKITTFNRNIFVKGFSAMLIAVKCVEDMVVWHAVSNDDGAYIYYHDQRLLSIDIQLEGPIPYSDWRHLMDARHIVGWCTKVTSYVGLSNASFLITKSNLGGPGVGFAFEKVTIGGGRYIPASTTIAIGNREKPPRSKTGDTYFGQLRMLASKFIVLYDVDEHRAWLVDGASALLHLLRMSLLIDERNGLKLLNTHLNIQDEARPTEKSRSLAVLQNNMNLKLLENPQDSCQETKITLKSGKEERTITHKKTWVLLKDRVNEIYSTLEEIINYQSDVSSQNGVGCRIRASPRRRLEGFDFLDVAAGGESWPKVATLKPTGKGWVDLVRELKAVTLFGRGFGDLISPSREVNIPVDNEGINTPGISTVCPAWAQVPIGKDYLSTSTTIIKDLVGNDIGRGDARPWQVSNNIYLHSPDKSFEACGCTKTDPKTRCDRVQVLIPRSFLGTRGFRRPSNLPPDGAVILGHSHKYPLHWKGTGDPVEGETDMEEQDPAFNDSGVETGTASTASMAPSSSHLHSSSADAKIGSNIAMLAPRGRRAAARENLKKTFKNLVKRRSGQNT